MSSASRSLSTACAGMSNRSSSGLAFTRASSSSVAAPANRTIASCSNIGSSRDRRIHSTSLRSTRPLHTTISSLATPTSCAKAAQPIASKVGLGQRRSFFSLPDISKLAGLNAAAADALKGGESNGDEQTFHARKILPYSQSQLYTLVSDVPSYASFIPFCTSSTVLMPSPPGASGPSPSSASGSRSGRRRVQTDWKPTNQPFDVEAELRVGFGGLEEAYVSKVSGRPFESVTAEAAEEAALFKSLRTTWSFSPASTLSPHPSNSTSTPPSPPKNPRMPNDTSSLSSDPTVGPTLLTIDLAFEFVNPLHRIASQAVLPKVAEKMVQAFEERCLEVYGKGTE